MSLERRPTGSFAVIRATLAPPPVLPAVTRAATYRMPGAGDMHPRQDATDGQSTASVTSGGSAGGAGSGTAMRPDNSDTRSYPQTSARQAMHADGFKAINGVADTGTAPILNVMAGTVGNMVPVSASNSNPRDLAAGK